MRRCSLAALTLTCLGLACGREPPSRVGAAADASAPAPTAASSDGQLDATQVFEALLAADAPSFAGRLAPLRPGQPVDAALAEVDGLRVTGVGGGQKLGPVALVPHALDDGDEQRVIEALFVVPESRPVLDRVIERWGPPRELDDEPPCWINEAEGVRVAYIAGPGGPDGGYLVVRPWTSVEQLLLVDGGRLDASAWLGADAAALPELLGDRRGWGNAVRTRTLPVGVGRGDGRASATLIHEDGHVTAVKWGVSAIDPEIVSEVEALLHERYGERWPNGVYPNETEQVSLQRSGRMLVLDVAAKP